MQGKATGMRQFYCFDYITLVIMPGFKTIKLITSLTGDVLFLMCFMCVIVSELH